MKQMDIGTTASPYFLSGGGEMGERIREYNWAATPLGPIDAWPQNLRTCIRIMLSSRQPIWIGWGRQLIKFYNDPYKAIVGGKHPWALGTPASMVWKDIWRDIEHMLKQVMEKGEGTYVESQLLIMERNGYPEETYYTFSYTPIPGDEGEIAGMFCANTDDTDRIISERQLLTLTRLGKNITDSQTSEEIIKKTIATLEENKYDFPFALFYSVENNKAVLTYATNLGQTADAVPKEIDLDIENEISQLLNEAAVTREMQVFNGLRLKLGDMPKGAWEVAPEKAIILPIAQAAAKEPYGFLVVGFNPYRLLDEKYSSFFNLVADQIATSFADVHALEEERKRAEALAEIDRAKTTFFSNISHELRTPLTLMLGPIEDALNDPATIPDNKERMDVAYRNGLRLQKLVNTLLEFSRIEAGRIEGQFSRVDLHSLTQDLASTFRSAVEKAGMELQIHAGEIKDEVYVDVDMWEKIILNLVSNAFKYSKAGRIDIRVTQSGSEVSVAVSDTGAGIPEDQLDKIFERFHRVENTTGRSQEGTGIGLAMVKELVKLHHGNISVKSKHGEGSTFTVSIPTGKDHLPKERIKQESEQSLRISKANSFIEEALRWVPEANAKLNGGGLPETEDPLNDKSSGHTHHVLLADDNADMRDYVSRLLQKNYKVKTVANGRLALEYARRELPDLVISDVMMPEMDGFELVKHLKNHPETIQIPVILLSARAGQEATIEGLQAGADDYMVKPFSARELISRIDSNIKIAQSRINAARQLHNLFMQAPVPICILKGAEHRFELANSLFQGIIEQRDIVGKTVLEAVPEIESQGLIEILDGVFTTGQPFFGNEFLIHLVINGNSEGHYFDFVYSPLYEIDNTISGIMVVALDVTHKVLARKALEKNEERLEQLVEQRTNDLKKINEALERSNHELEQFAFVTSHDLQEPLRKIQ
ncbi:MAG: ATP-binding protein, partial [Chitinophagaceae bacterium]